MPEWIRERGIGETRLALVDGHDIVEARVLLDDVIPAGRLIDARLMRSGRNGLARDAAGNEYLLPAGAGRIAEGAAVTIVVTRSAIPGAEPWKRPLAKVATGADTDIASRDVRDGRLPASWNDLIEEARSGIVRFDGGELRLSPTPAMTLIDVDGTRTAEDLSMDGARAAAQAIRRLDIGGSIGIDLPTTGSKSARQAAAVAIDEALPQPFERTAVNGFGFVQIVRPRKRASLLELAQDRAAFEARDLLRRTSSEAPGARRLVAHPVVVELLERHPDWLASLARLLGGEIGLRADAKLPMSGGYAEPF
ncbi:ribonuclease [Sphingomonas lutea]|uniref:Ribonuclease n=1 Tax=Sphingomonas lutea TaxID=1045317 RepID=A0A7G9SI19_9SPHN|nr:ribonuclease [Sphingomonas lutea]QNN67494.1 ribonuclease [Sphingomonas lutea]